MTSEMSMVTKAFLLQTTTVLTRMKSALLLGHSRTVEFTSAEQTDYIPKQ